MSDIRTMRCEVCGQGPVDGITVFRVSPKGKPGIWRCECHLSPEQADPELMALTDIIGQADPHDD